MSAKESFAELLAGFIVDKFCAKVGVESADDLEALIGRVAKRELPDLSGLEALPAQLIGQVNGVLGQLGGLPAQVISGVLDGLKTLIPRSPL